MVSEPDAVLRFYIAYGEARPLISPGLDCFSARVEIGNAGCIEGACLPICYPSKGERFGFWMRVLLVALLTFEVVL